MKTIPIYTGISAAFQKLSQFTLHNLNVYNMTIHVGKTIDMYKYIPCYLDGGHVCVLGAVE